jgi:hypothetical protein
MPPALMMAIRNRLGGMQGATGMPGVVPQPGAMPAGVGGAAVPTPMQLAIFKRARSKKMGGMGKMPKAG